MVLLDLASIFERMKIDMNLTSIDKKANERRQEHFVVCDPAISCPWRNDSVVPKILGTRQSVAMLTKEGKARWDIRETFGRF